MKTSLVICFAVALLLAAAPFARSASPDTPVRLRVELDRSVLPADSPERAIVKVALEGARLARPEARPPVNLALVIDRSGSMGGAKIAQARAAALEAVSRLGSDDIVALVAFDDRVETLYPAQPLGDGRALAAAIAELRPGGTTALFAGVEQGAAEVRKHSEDRRYVSRIVLISDGDANVGPRSPNELGGLGAALMEEGISVTTIGLGLDYNEDLMTRLAQRSDGNTYFAAGAADLPRIFAAELGDVLDVVARRVTVTVQFPTGVRPLRMVGREGVVRGQTAEITLNQLYGGQEKFALVEAEIEPAPAGVEREIASATATFDDAGTQRRLTLTMRAGARFSGSHDLVVASANLRVQSDYAANAIAVAKEQAIALADAGRRADAASVLRREAQRLEAMGRIYSNGSVLSISASNTAEADRLGRDGLDNATRKDYRTDGANTYSQQATLRQP